ncbi:MAG TPA: hypothetical protein VNO83_04025 [Pseudonocardia sp.]|nr:hypothetical protein [Pseudonocardia sp.]
MASTSGLRCGRISTAVPSVSRLVAAATYASCTIASRIGVRGSTGASAAVGSTTWSCAHQDS